MDEVSQIKDRIDIVELVGAYLTVKKTGVNYKALCPFHTEKTPSFMVSPERQTFKCFGCNEGGDIFTFIEKMEGVDFYNALKILADRAGVKLSPKRIKYGDKEYQPDETTRLFEINDWTARVYHKILLDHPKAEHARKYLKKRGLLDKTIADFRIGYAPNSWEFLIKFLNQKKYQNKEIFKAGLLVQKANGDFYDRFRGRITFPINNTMGACVGFTTRILDDLSQENQGAKYINSAESPIYRKSKILYGLDSAKMAIKDQGLAIIVEGNMDVIACHQAGFKNVVASSGTALTADQLIILSRYAGEIAFSFDQDPAGEQAMKRAVILALSNDISAKIISLPLAYKDPDEAISANPKYWQEALKKAKPALEHWIDLLFRKSNVLDVAAKKKIAKEILPVIKMIYSEIEKEHYLKFLSMRLGVSEQSLNQTLNKTKGTIVEKKSVDTKKASPEYSIFEKLAGVIWNNFQILNKISQTKFENISYQGDDNLMKIFYRDLIAYKISKNNFSTQETNQLDQISLAIMADFDNQDEEVILSEIEYLVKTIEREQREKIKQEYIQKIKVAETEGDREKIKKLLAELSGLIK